MNVSEWELINCSTTASPQQTNGYDCGRGSTPRLPPWDLFFWRRSPKKASREGQMFRKTEVAESRPLSHGCRGCGSLHTNLDKTLLWDHVEELKTR
jgi:hypothetical protein